MMTEKIYYKEFAKFFERFRFNYVLVDQQNNKNKSG